MKSLYLLLFAFLIYQYSCQETECSGIATKKSDCEGRKLGEGFYRCCYGESKMTKDGQTTENKFCVPVTQDQYDNIKDYIDKSKKEYKEKGVEVKKLSVDCSSNFLVFSFLSLILFLI